ncbi:MAG TPA: SCO family protein [Albitalea sp.]|nr:SCO family protein [Albitalea sp.]
MKRVVALALLAAACTAWGAGAQPLALPQAPNAGLTQRLDASLPLALRLVDAQGRAVRLHDYFDAGRPVLLVLGYYRCPQLCGLLMHGVLQALHDAHVPRSAVRIVGVSIDPGDTPATARARRDLDLAYADFLQGARPPDAALDLHLLTGAPADTARLAQAVGWRYEARADDAIRDGGAPTRFAHPAAVVVITPQGRVSRYLMGVRFDPAELRDALVEASQGRIGTVGDRIALLCAHIDERFGRHSAAVMAATRIVGVLLVVALGAWCWRRRAGGPPGAGAR